MPEVPASFMVQMKKFFGQHPNNPDLANLSGFKKEIDELTEQDRKDFTEMLNKAGFPVIGS